MAYDRARRFPKLITQTPPKIGPGTYDISELPQPKRHLADFYPFLSGTKRKTIAIPRDSERLPGPSTYRLKEPARHGGVSIDFTEVRFKERIPESPGPVDYDVPTDFLKPQKIRSHPGTWRGPAGKLWLTRPPRSIIPTATSVPDKNYAGYAINEYGTLVRNLPVRKRSTFLYNVPREETNTTTLMYKGNFWSRMTGRTESRPFLTPGPGDYEHETKMTATQVHNEAVREAKRMSSWQPRFLDTLYRNKIRENFPAPNSYNVKGDFDKYFAIPCKCDPDILEPAPFGQTSKRFDYGPLSDAPGPGTYDPRVQLKCTGSIYQTPFGVCAGRFRKVSEETRPGPSDYHLNVGNLAYESQKRYRYTSTRPVQPEVYLDEMTMYKEEDYDSECSEEEIEEEKSKVYHAAFRSRTERFPTVEKAAPDPGAYEVLTAFKANRDKCEFLCPRMAAPFGTRSVRRLQIAREDNDMPDPTYYNVSGDISETAKGGVIARSRPIGDASVTPAPDRYCIHPYLSSSVVKKSFNVSLGKPKAIAELEEQEKQDKVARCPCVRKKLRWFSPTVQEYKCHTFSI